MMTILFFIALIWVVFKLFVLGLKAAWGITKFICTVFILPAVIVGLFLIGLVYIAIGNYSMPEKELTEEFTWNLYQ